MSKYLLGLALLVLGNDDGSSSSLLLQLDDLGLFGLGHNGLGGLG